MERGEGRWQKRVQSPWFRSQNKDSRGPPRGTPLPSPIYPEAVNREQGFSAVSVYKLPTKVPASLKEIHDKLIGNTVEPVRSPNMTKK